MGVSKMTIVLLGIFAIILISFLVGITVYGIKNLYPGSGAPSDIAPTFTELIKNYGQMVVGLFITAALVALLLDGKVSENAVLPIISLITGYLLGGGVKAKFDK